MLCIAVTPALAADSGTEEDRVEQSGHVLKEILNIPDDIPQDLLDKAECIVVLPSVKKAAFGVGASYGRGVMICRSGLTTPDRGDRRRCMRWKAPASASRSADRRPISCCW